VSGRARRAASRRPMRGRHRPCARRAPSSAASFPISHLWGRIFRAQFRLGAIRVVSVVNQNQWAPARAVFVRKYSMTHCARQSGPSIAKIDLCRAMHLGKA
jgi:hypothetical protein